MADFTDPIVFGTVYPWLMCLRRLDYMGSPGLGFPPDPSSTEGVLKVLKESRKRDVVEDDCSFTAEQHSKRRYLNLCFIFLVIYY